MEPMEEELEKLKAEHRKELSALQIRSELRVELAKRGAHNVDVAAGAVDLSGVRLEENGSIPGIGELVSRLQESDPYLFRGGAGTSGGAGTTGTTGAGEGAGTEPLHTGSRHGTSVQDPDRMSDAEYYRWLGERTTL